MRKTLVKFHLWLGLVIGLLWAIQGLSGALLVFHRDIEHAFRPVASPGPMASLDTAIRRAESVAGRPIKRIGIADRSGDILVAEYVTRDKEPLSLLIDAAGGQILAKRELAPGSPMTGSGWRWIYLLHYSLLSGDRGETLIGISGLLLLTSAATGLWIGWPRRRKWRGVFSVAKWRSIDQQLYGWHRMAGLIIGFALLLVAACGAYLVFADNVRKITERVIPYRPVYRASPVAVPSAWTLGADEALANARARFPHATFVRLALPSAKAPVYAVRLRQPGEVRPWSGATVVTIHAVQARIVDVYDPLDAPLGNRIYDATLPTHNGEIASLPGRLMVMAAGLSLPLMYITGIWAWWRRRARKRQARPAVPRNVRRDRTLITNKNSLGCGDDLII